MVQNARVGRSAILIVFSYLLGHPYEPTIAASGIDSTIKIFSPDLRAQDDARQGINILNPHNATSTSFSCPTEAENGMPHIGLKSCKRMRDSYEIMSQNDVDRQGGMSDAYVTVCSFTLSGDDYVLIPFAITYPISMEDSLVNNLSLYDCSFLFFLGLSPADLKIFFHKEEYIGSHSDNVEKSAGIWRRLRHTKCRTNRRHNCCG